MYAQVYVYQIHFHRHLENTRLHRALRNTVTADDWKNRWMRIESISQQIDQALETRMGSRTMEIWKRVEQINTTTDRIETTQKDRFKTIQVNIVESKTLPSHNSIDLSSHSRTTL